MEDKGFGITNKTTYPHQGSNVIWHLPCAERARVVREKVRVGGVPRTSYFLEMQGSEQRYPIVSLRDEGRSPAMVFYILDEEKRVCALYTDMLRERTEADGSKERGGKVLYANVPWMALGE